MSSSDLLGGASLIFDLDGTLVDTAPDITAALNHVLTKEGRTPLLPERVRSLVGRGAETLIVEGFQATGEPLAAERVPALFKVFIEHYRDHIADTSRPFPGVREALERFRAAGARLGVCTNKPYRPSIALLEALDLRGFFPVVMGADSVSDHKPHPDHFRAAVRELNGDLGTSVMIGDSPVDAATARAAGVPMIAVTFGYTLVAPAEFGADALIDHFDALEEAVLRALDARRRPG